MNRAGSVIILGLPSPVWGLQQAQADLGNPTQFRTLSPIESPTNDTAYLIANFDQEAALVSLFKQNNDGTTDGSYGA